MMCQSVVCFELSKAPQSPMNDRHGLGTTQPLRDLPYQIAQSVAVLREDDQLFDLLVGIIAWPHFSARMLWKYFCEKACKFAPFCIFPTSLDGEGKIFQSLQNADFGL